MLAYTYISHGKFELIDKPKPELQDLRDAIVRITLGSICTSDLHIKHGSVPRAVPGITVGHEMVGVVEDVGSEVRNVKAGEVRGYSFLDAEDLRNLLQVLIILRIADNRQYIAARALLFVFAQYQQRNIEQLDL